jgi:drug/metabolite transporter (DMT)-like permease
MGITSSIGRNMEIYATQFAAPTTVALLRYVGVLYYFLVDILLFKQDFTFLQLLGASMMLITNIVSSVIKI